MATNLPANVHFAPKGTVYTAPVGTTTLYDVTTTPPVAWKELGYVDENGVEATPALTTSPITAWQSAVAIKYLVTGASFQLKFVLQQFDKESVEMFFGAAFLPAKDAAAATIAGQYSLDISSAPVQAEFAMVVHWEDATAKNRLVLPRVAVTSRDALKLTRTANQQLGVTLDALDTGGSLGKILTNVNMA